MILFVPHFLNREIEYIGICRLIQGICNKAIPSISILCFEFTEWISLVSVKLYFTDVMVKIFNLQTNLNHCKQLFLLFNSSISHISFSPITGRGRRESDHSRPQSIWLQEIYPGCSWATILQFPGFLLPI